MDASLAAFVAFMSGCCFGLWFGFQLRQQVGLKPTLRRED